MKFLILFFIAFSVSLNANWEEQLRVCEYKEGNHAIPGIDFIYMINLKVRPEKWKTCLKQLEPYGIIPYRFEAINGWEMKEGALYNLGCPDMVPDMTCGKAACILSHLSVLYDAYKSGYKTIWVMEDDIDVVENPLQVSSLIEALDGIVSDWDILYTDIDTKDFYGNRVPCRAIYQRPNFSPAPLEYYLRRLPINETFIEIGMRYGAYSMIIRRSGIKKILDYFGKYRLYLPIDMELFFVPGIKQIALTRDIISTLPGIKSDTTYPPTLNNLIKN